MPENISKENKLLSGRIVGVRHVIGLHLLLLVAIGFGMRAHLSVAIVAMTERTSDNSNVPIYEWHNKSVVLSSFYWGYVVLQIFAGSLSRKYSPKYLLLIAMTLNSLIFMAIPFAATFSSYGVIMCRVLQGLFQGYFYPLGYTILGAWSPVSERSSLFSVIANGCVFGTLVTLAVVGYVCSLPIGWPITFYGHGIIGLIWVVLWGLNGASTPADHWYISKVEREYIENSIGLDKNQRQEVTLRTPWKEILRSPAIWALLICHCAHSYGFITIVTEMPTFIFQVLKFDIKHDGFTSSLPFIASLALGFIFPYLADLIMTRRWMGRAATRKLFTFIGLLVPTVALITLSFLPSDASTIAVVMLVLSMGFNSAVNGGFFVSHVDISPNYVGSLIGLCNSAGNFVGALALLVVQFILVDETDKSLWDFIFRITSLNYFMTVGVYELFGSSTTQWWNVKHANGMELYVV